MIEQNPGGSLGALVVPPDRSSQASVRTDRRNHSLIHFSGIPARSSVVCHRYTNPLTTVCTHLVHVAKEHATTWLWAEQKGKLMISKLLLEPSKSILHVHAIHALHERLWESTYQVRELKGSIVRRVLRLWGDRDHAKEITKILVSHSEETETKLKKKVLWREILNLYEDWVCTVWESQRKEEKKEACCDET